MEDKKVSWIPGSTQIPTKDRARPALAIGRGITTAAEEQPLVRRQAAAAVEGDTAQRSPLGSHSVIAGSMPLASSSFTRLT